MTTERVTLRARISDYFGSTYIHEMDPFMIDPLSEAPITFSLGDIPRYGLGFTVFLQVENSPVSLLGKGYDPIVLELVRHDYMDSFFIFPRWLVILVVCCLIVFIILWRLSAKRKKKDMEELERMIQERMDEIAAEHVE